MALLAVTLCNCGGGDDPVPTPNPGPDPGPDPTPVEVKLENLVGEWQLTSWTGADAFPGEGRAIYLKLDASGNFTLYQKTIQVAGVVSYKGSFTLDVATATVSGKYSDNENWANSYVVSAITSSTMNWTAVGTTEVSKFTRTQIPSEIIGSAQPAETGVRSAGDFRFL